MEAETKPSGLATSGVGEKHVDPETGQTVIEGNVLHRNLQGRHMQMIAMYVDIA